MIAYFLYQLKGLLFVIDFQEKILKNFLLALICL